MMNPYRLWIGTVLAAVAATVPVALTVATQPADAAFRGNDGEVAFVRGTRAAQATGEVYVMGRDGSAQTRLTNNAVFDGLPAFSPDGGKIAFTSRRNSQGPAVNDEIFVMDPKDADGDGNGDSLVQITSTANENEFQPAFSPDGEKIAFTSSQGGNEIFVMDADGTDRVRLTNNAARDARPAFSPRGDRIAFTSNRPGPDGVADDEVFVMDAADRDGDGNGDNLAQITDNATVLVNNARVLVNDTHANFSPNGERVAFTSNRESSALQPNDDIYLADADGDGTPTRITRDGAVDEFPAFSPDGEDLAFSSNRDGNFEIYSMGASPEDPTDNKPVRLTENPEIDSKPDWGPSLYDFGGFYEPVDNPPTTNIIKAGSAVPAKFDLGGDQGLDVLAAESPRSARVDCDSGATTDEIEQTATAGGGLTYDETTGLYVYVWKTERTWSGTCREFVLELDDGTSHRATFRFR